jgi:drug/metabolite transporter (DMT)-like permease
MQNVRRNNLILYHFIVFLYGFTSVTGALISLAALPLVVYRMLIAAAGLALFFLFFHLSYFRLARPLWGKVVLGGILIGTHWVTFFYAIKIAGVSLALSMMATGALITAFIDPLISKRKLLGYEVFFGGITALGIAIIYQAEFEHLKGISIALLSAFLSSLFTILNGKMVQEARAITLSFYELLVGSLVGIVVAYFSDMLTIQAFTPQGWDWLWLLLLGLLGTSFAFNMSIQVMRHLSSFTIMMVINLEPIYGILLALAIWNEKAFMSVNFYIGFFIVLIAILMHGVYKHRKEGQKKSVQL